MRKPHTIIVKFQRYKDRIRVWRAKKTLQGSNIFINQDFPQEINDRRHILRPILSKAKASGKEAFLNVDILIIEGRRYTTEDLHKLPADLNAAKIATPQIGENVLGFFGGQLRFRNFHIARFMLNGITYDCEERHYLSKKANFAKLKESQ